MNAVIFDMDGVLLDSEPLHAQADREMLGRLGIEVEPGYLDRFVGVTAPVMWAEILDEKRVSADLGELLNASLSIKLKLLKKGDYAPIEGVVPLLAELYRKHVPVVIASSSPGIFIKEAVKKLGISRYVRDWVSAESVPKSKPEPDVFLKAAERLELGPEQCVVIEDSTNGVLAARRAGMKCVGFRNPNSGNQDVSKADLVVGSMAEVTFEALKKL